MFKVLGLWILFCNGVEGSIPKIGPFEELYEGDKLQLECSDSNTSPHASASLIWLMLNDEGNRMINAERSSRHDVKRIPDCENKTLTCLILVIRNISWYDDKTVFQCCRSIDNAKCLDRKPRIIINNITKLKISIVVNYKTYSRSTVVTYAGKDVTLTCPININHTRIKMIWKRRNKKKKWVLLRNRKPSLGKKYRNVGRLTDTEHFFKCRAISRRGTYRNTRTHRIKVIVKSIQNITKSTNTTRLKFDVHKGKAATIVGAVAGACAFVIIVTGAGYYLTKRYKMDQELENIKASKTPNASDISFTSLNSGDESSSKAMSSRSSVASRKRRRGNNLRRNNSYLVKKRLY